MGFQSFGSEVEEIKFGDSTHLIGANGTGKTAVLEALCRLFSNIPGLRRVQLSDFHVPHDEAMHPLESRTLMIEADFSFPELSDEDGDASAVPQNFSHMRLDDRDGVPIVKFRLDATLYDDGDIETAFNYVVNEGDNEPKLYPVNKEDRDYIHVHYLPARRNPTDHISASSATLVGRLLRAVEWDNDQEEIKNRTEEISDLLEGNDAVSSIGEVLSEHWQELHKGEYFSKPNLSFSNDNIEALIKHLTISFSPSHDDKQVDSSKLSDGQKSLLYLTLVLTLHQIGQDVLGDDNDAFDIEKLKPPIYTMIAMEEPENSLSTHNLARVLNVLSNFSQNDNAQTVLATHSPLILSRVEPENIRYLRLNTLRQTQVKSILMPQDNKKAYKYVRQAVRAFPEIYFSRLVILGEGDSEQIVLPRLFEAKGIGCDENGICIVPLGGRHVNHFWKLLHDLNIPYLTLLDFDLGRFGGGWGRIKYAAKQLLKFPPSNSSLTQKTIDEIPRWNSEIDAINSDWIEWLKNVGVYFSSPLDIDLAMMMNFQIEYGVDSEPGHSLDQGILESVLGKSHSNVDKYTEDHLSFFYDYHRLFKVGSKTVQHIKALSLLDNDELLDDMPTVYEQLIDTANVILDKLPE